MEILTMNTTEYKKLLKKEKPKKHNNQPEYHEQVKVFQWAKLNEKKYPCLKYLNASLAGVKLQTHQQANRAKAMGMKAGYPDIFLPFPTYRESEGESWGYHALFIELKSKKGKVSMEQEKWIDYLNDQEYYAALCFGADDAIETIINYLEGKL